MSNELIIPNSQGLSFDERTKIFRKLVDQAARRADGNEESDLRALGSLIIDHHRAVTEVDRRVARQKFNEALEKLSPAIEARKEVEAAMGFIALAEGKLLGGR